MNMVTTRYINIVAGDTDDIVDVELPSHAVVSTQNTSRDELDRLLAELEVDIDANRDQLTSDEVSQLQTIVAYREKSLDSRIIGNIIQTIPVIRSRVGLK